MSEEETLEDRVVRLEALFTALEEEFRISKGNMPPPSRRAVSGERVNPFAAVAEFPANIAKRVMQALLVGTRKTLDCMYCGERTENTFEIDTTWRCTICKHINFGRAPEGY